MVIASGICGWAVNPLVFSLLLDLCRILFSLFLFIKWLWWFCACCHGNSTRVTHSKQPAAKYGCLLYHDHQQHHRVEGLECIDTGCFTIRFHSFFFFLILCLFSEPKRMSVCTTSWLPHFVFDKMQRVWGSPLPIYNHVYLNASTQFPFPSWWPFCNECEPGLRLGKKRPTTQLTFYSLRFSSSSHKTTRAIRSLACHRPLRDYQGGALASVEGVLAPALVDWSAAGARGAGGRFGSELHGEAVPDAEAVESVFLRYPERCLLRLALHGFIGLRPAAEGKPGEAAVCRPELKRGSWACRSYRDSSFHGTLQDTRGHSWRHQCFKPWTSSPCKGRFYLGFLHSVTIKNCHYVTNV